MHSCYCVFTVVKLKKLSKDFYPGLIEWNQEVLKWTWNLGDFDTSGSLLDSLLLCFVFQGEGGICRGYVCPDTKTQETGDQSRSGW